MKVIDREGRLFGKISVIDLLVIAAVAVIALAVYVKNNETPTGTSPNLPQEERITFQIKVSSVEKYLADAIQEGDKVYDTNYSSGGRPVGEITRIQVLNDPGIILSDEVEDGAIVEVEVEDTVDLIITIEGTGIIDGRTYMINRVYQLGINAARTYKSNKATFGGTVIKIN